MPFPRRFRSIPWGFSATPYDIIDNRRENLVDHIRAVLPQASMARFAVGYLFLSGLEALGKDLDAIQELRLLIGNTSSRETMELLTEGYRRLDLVEDRLEGERYNEVYQKR